MKKEATKIIRQLSSGSLKTVKEYLDYIVYPSMNNNYSKTFKIAITLDKNNERVFTLSVYDEEPLC